MKNQLLALDETFFKQFVITDSEILYTSTPHASLGSLLKSREKPATSEMFCRLTLTDITAVQYNSQEETLCIFHSNAQGSQQEEVFRFAGFSWREAVAQYLADTLGLHLTVRKEYPTRPLLVHSALVLLIWGCTLYALNISIQVQQGRTYDFAGSRRNIVGLLHAVGQHLSPPWVSALGLVIGAVVAYLGYRRYVNPAQVHLFKK